MVSLVLLILLYKVFQSMSSIQRKMSVIYFVTSKFSFRIISLSFYIAYKHGHFKPYLIPCLIICFLQSIHVFTIRTWDDVSLN